MELLDREALGGLSRLGSLLWAAANLAVGLLLWVLGVFVHRDGVDPRWLLVPLTVVCAALPLRRTRPGTGLAVATAGLAVDAAVLGPSVWPVVVYGDLLYAAAVWGGSRLVHGVVAAVTAGGVATLGLGGFLVRSMLVADGLLGLLQLIGLYTLVFVTPLTGGLSVRAHRARAELERQRAAQIARLAELDRANAVAAERARMARELHDVVANHLSAVAVQSTAALALRDFDPERVRGVLRVVRDNSVRGLAEMRRMIEVLRAGDRPDPEPVAPRLGEAGRLVAVARDAGLDVVLDGVEDVGELPARVDAAAYRIVQECLTNALRYAAPQRVRIVVGRAGASDGAVGLLVVEAVNPVAESAQHAVPEGLGAGAGLAGMRERAALLGGRLRAGPDGDGSWRVRAELPVEP
ncbi:two-component sensor histidine kinase [Thermobifida halotolerans]|uniref:histidine kinase n=1 Tax=Thermobifida halotolerans TaxID=483545 RepID=A0A399G9Z5_9ACTN|nr:two-component sensor histidine kinase [Thermobifida halotolerans]